MDEGRIGLLRAVGVLVEMLLEDGPAAEDGFSCLLPLRRGLLFDLADEIGDLLLQAGGDGEAGPFLPPDPLGRRGSPQDDFGEPWFKSGLWAEQARSGRA
jgi:hypothetical protein